MRIPKPCLGCGELTLNQSRCDDCFRAKANADERTRYATHGPRTRLEGHRDKQWVALSKKARRMQPWCSQCGADEDLTTDHSEEAWDAYYTGQKITIEMVSVYCRSCNSAKGTTRGKWISEQ